MRGDLSETTAAGACRSLATRRASGALLIDATDATGLIRFREGRIVGVASPAPGARVGDRLVGAGVLARSAFDEVSDAQRHGSETRPLHRALVERGLVPVEAVDGVLRGRMLDGLLELNQLETGTLVFLTDEELHAGGSSDDEVAGPALDVDDAFRAVAERQEELVELRRRAPDATVVPAPTARADDHLHGEALDADAATILGQVDGHRSLEDIAVAVGYGVLEVTRIVNGLVSAGVVELERPWDAVGDELDDAIRQLASETSRSDTSSPGWPASDTSTPADPAPTSRPQDDPASVGPATTGPAQGHAASVDPGSPAGDGGDDVVPPAATTDPDGPRIEAELPDDPEEPAPPAPERRPASEVPSPNTAEASPTTPAADDASASWDDLFGGDDTARSTAAPTAEPAPEPTTPPVAEPIAAPSTDPAGPPATSPTETPTDATRDPTPGEGSAESPGGSRPPTDPPPFFADTHRPQRSSSGPTSGGVGAGSGPDSVPTAQPTGPAQHDDPASPDDGTDVSEFLRELSRLALGEDAPARPRRSGVEPPGPGEAPRPAADQDDDHPRRPHGPADSDHARRRRGFFGRG